MVITHPCIKNVRVAEQSRNRFRPVKTLIIETNLTLPSIGEPCHDDRLDSLLAYLEELKIEAQEFFGAFEAVEIRGMDEECDDINVPTAPQAIERPLYSLAS